MVVVSKPQSNGAANGAANGKAGFHDAKLATARFYMARVLPESSALFTAIMAGKKPIMAMDEAAF